MLERAIKRVVASSSDLGQAEQFQVAAIGAVTPSEPAEVATTGHANAMDLSAQVSHPSTSQLGEDFSKDTAPFPAYPQLTRKVITTIASLANGDGRAAISLLELALSSSKDSDEASLLSALKRSVSTSYDRTGDSHYDAISGTSAVPQVTE